jgi:hypothetical protein
MSWRHGSWRLMASVVEMEIMEMNGCTADLGECERECHVPTVARMSRDQVPINVESTRSGLIIIFMQESTYRTHPPHTPLTPRIMSQPHHQEAEEELEDQEQEEQFDVNDIVEVIEFGDDDDAPMDEDDEEGGGLEMVMEDEGMEGEEDEDEEPVEDNSLGHARESASAAASCFYFLRERSEHWTVFRGECSELYSLASASTFPRLSTADGTGLELPFESTVTDFHSPSFHQSTTTHPRQFSPSPSTRSSQTHHSPSLAVKMTWDTSSPHSLLPLHRPPPSLPSSLSSLPATPTPSSAPSSRTMVRWLLRVEWMARSESGDGLKGNRRPQRRKVTGVNGRIGSS